MQNSVVTNSRSSRVASYSKLKAVGIAAAALTMILGIVASRMIDDGGGFTVAESAAAVAFFVWMICAAVMLVRLCKWLYATRATRTQVRNLLWILVLVWAPMIVPLIVRSPAEYRVSPEG